MASNAMMSQSPSMIGYEPQRERDGLGSARVAFTGRLASMTRRDAQRAVRRAGGQLASSVSRHTTHLVVGARGWPIRPDGRVTRSLERAEALRRREIPVRIISEDEFLTLLWGERVEDRPAPEGPKSYPLGEVAALVGVEPHTIERWEHLGLVRSHEDQYDFRDIVSLQSIASLVRSGASPDAIRAALQALSSVLPGVDRPLAQLKIVVAASGELLAQIGESLIDPQGQQRLDFEGVAEIAEVKTGSLSSSATAMPDAPGDCFEHALALEEEERYEAAAALYRRAIALSPGWAEAHFNLANVLRMLERDEGAEEIYLLAVAMDPSNELAWYNLADVQEEEGRLDAAVESLHAAIRACPTFADAHFNLASCLEQLGDRDGAKRHWGSYLKLDPESEWATIARDHLRR